MDCNTYPYLVYAGLSAALIMSEWLGWVSSSKANSIIELVWNLIRNPTPELEEQLIHVVLEGDGVLSKLPNNNVPGDVGL